MEERKSFTLGSREIFFIVKNENGDYYIDPGVKEKTILIPITEEYYKKVSGFIDTSPMIKEKEENIEEFIKRRTTKNTKYIKDLEELEDIVYSSMNLVMSGLPEEDKKLVNIKWKRQKYLLISYRNIIRLENNIELNTDLITKISDLID